MKSRNRHMTDLEINERLTTAIDRLEAKAARLDDVAAQVQRESNEHARNQGNLD